MKKLLFALVLFSGFSFGQKIVNTPPPPKIEDFRFISGSMNESIVIEVKNTPKKVIYSKILDYIKKNYMDYNEVLMAKVDNEMIRFQGISANVLNLGNLHENDGLYYVIQVDVKDDKIKVTPLILKMVTEDHKKYSLNIPLPEKTTDYGITYDYKDVPNELNRVSSKIITYINNTEENNW